MPWNIPQKKVIRDNSRNTGSTVWDQDAQVSQPIDATGHDYHDEDLANAISETLNINGINAMAANLDMGGFKMIGMADGVNPTDGVTKSQLDAVSNAQLAYLRLDGSSVMLGILDMGTFQIKNLATPSGNSDAVTKLYVDSLFLRLDGLSSMGADLNMGSNKIVNTAPAVGAGEVVVWEQIQGLPAADNLITAVTWDGTTLAHTRVNGDFTTQIKLINELKAGQIIRHKGADLTAAATTALTVNNGNRWYMSNNLGGAMNLNFIKPTGADPELGENYFVEGLVVIENGATPATITLQSDGVAVAAGDIVGSQSIAANDKYTLSYILQRTTGDTYRETYVWSTG